MTISTTNKPPMWFWIVSVLALIWNGMGVMQYLQQAYNTESFQAMCTPEELEVYANLPSWYTAVFAFAVFGGVLGCIALLLRKKIAYVLLLISLIAVIIQMSYVTFSLKMANIMTPMIVIVSILLVWLATSATKRGWIT